jgi:hypothetical protein
MTQHWRRRDPGKQKLGVNPDGDGRKSRREIDGSAFLKGGWQEVRCSSISECAFEFNVGLGLAPF